MWACSQCWSVFFYSVATKEGNKKALPSNIIIYLEEIQDKIYIYIYIFIFSSMKHCFICLLEKLHHIHHFFYTLYQSKNKILKLRTKLRWIMYACLVKCLRIKNTLICIFMTQNIRLWQWIIWFGLKWKLWTMIQQYPFFSVSLLSALLLLFCIKHFFRLSIWNGCYKKIIVYL